MQTKTLNRYGLIPAGLVAIAVAAALSPPAVAQERPVIHLVCVESYVEGREQEQIGGLFCRVVGIVPQAEEQAEPQRPKGVQIGFDESIKLRF